MDFELSVEQKLFQKLVAQFANDVCRPEAEALDISQEFPVQTWKKMANLGLFRVNHETAYGGVGLDPLMEMIAIIELSKASLVHGASYALLAHGFPTFIEKYGTVEQKKKYIEPILNGESIGAFCLTEPDAGSDAMGIKSKSKKVVDGYVLNGTKQCDSRRFI